MVNFIDILLGLAAISYFLYRYLTRNFDYWEKRNVAGPTPIPFFGNFKDVARRKIHSADLMKQFYDAYPNEPAVGIFQKNEPILLLRDLEMMKDVLIRYFASFPNRTENINFEIDPLSQHLIHLNVERWRPMRKKLAPTFSSGKLKEMFYLIDECTKYFVKYLEKLTTKSESLECYSLAAKLTIAVIGECAFGLNLDTMQDSDNQFFKHGRAWLADSWSNYARRTARYLPAWLVKPIKRFVRNDEVVKFFVQMMTSTMEHRKVNNIRRNDFVDLLMDLKDNPNQIEGEEMTDMLLTSQALVFFLAGYDTSAVTISHAMYELACNPDIQDKLRSEIEMTLDKNDRILSYDAVKNMVYLDKVYKETLRKYPVAFYVPRIAKTDHTFSGSGISVTKGTTMLISTYAIHHDPRYYPDPDKFDPERFDEANEKLRPPMSFIPFSHGPRNCIGGRFAGIQSKLGIVSIVRHFQLDRCQKTFEVYKKDFNGFLSPLGGIHLKITKFQDS